MIKIDDSGGKHVDSTVVFIVVYHCGEVTYGDVCKPCGKCQQCVVVPQVCLSVCEIERD